ncbi:hypothetical protein K440DRAFT_645578 [Wilcoxina mikolae CBS 423.85]|nr:hypothetical protein K440DRAFT_645578 [Wilcoxina mikolae CBS 423.85]
MLPTVLLLTLFTLASALTPGPYREDLASTALDAFDAKVLPNPDGPKGEFRTQLELEHGKPQTDEERLYGELGRNTDRRPDHIARLAGAGERRHRVCDHYVGGRCKDVAGPTIELDFGYNKGSKYDNGYGFLRSYDQCGVETVEELAMGLGHDPGYIWGAGREMEAEAAAATAAVQG